MNQNRQHNEMTYKRNGKINKHIGYFESCAIKNKTGREGGMGGRRLKILCE